MPDSSAFNIPASPVAALGTITLLVAYVVAGFSAATGIIGNAKEKRSLVTFSVYSLYGFFALMMFASALIIYAFVTHDYSIKYVAHYSDTTMPLHYKITAYWGGLDGSLMFWVSVLAAFSAVAVRANQTRHRDMIGYVVGVIMLVQIFFLTLLIYNKNPFATFLVAPPVDGKGLNPLLQNYWMVIHPPSLYVGFVAATIPFAFGIAALASGRLDDAWLASVRVWTLICWFFLSLGLILGGRWAYEELGWGGYWAWDPVENAGLIPWFTMTAFLHSVIVQEQRGMMKVWNLVLVIATFFLTILGTSMTRGGFVQSVHAFGQDNELVLLFMMFMVFILVASLGLLIHRLPRLRSVNRFESFASREFAFLLNNWILLGCAFFVLFSTLWPTLKELFVDRRITLGPPHFNLWMAPAGIVLLFLAGAAPLLAYRRTTPNKLIQQFTIPVGVAIASMVGLALAVPGTRSFTPMFHSRLSLPVTLVCMGIAVFTIASVFQEFVVGTRVRRKQTGSDPLTALIGLCVAKRRRYGGYVIHLGVAMMFIGFAGGSWGSMDDFTVQKEGEVWRMRAYSFRHEGLITTNDDHKKAVTARVGLYLGDVREVATDDVVLLPPGDLGVKSEVFSFPVAEGKGTIKAKWNAGRILARVEGAADDVAPPITFVEKNGKVHVARPVGGWAVFPSSMGGAGQFRLAVGEELAAFEPAKWQYKKLPDQPTTEVDMHNRLEEDIYIILTGFDPDTGRVNFRVYINPLIQWLWLGFGVLALGTLICIGTPAWMRKLPFRLRWWGAFLLVALSATSASAQGQEYSSGSAHQVGVSAAHMHRPKDRAFLAPYRAKLEAQARAEGIEAGTPAFENRIEQGLAPIVRLTEKAMKDLVCLCGGCSRETLLECRCGFAAAERKELLAILGTHDLLTKEGRQTAYQDALDKFVAKYEAKREGDGYRVLMVPPKSTAWVVPLILVIGGLLGLFALTRRWVRSGRAAVAESVAETQEAANLADRLDDELLDAEE